MANDFYKQLFSAQENLQPDLVCQFVPQKVTDQMNSKMERPFSMEEVERALFAMAPNKSSGVDGFIADFFQNTGVWSKVRSQGQFLVS